jgi:hypothetical protein
LRAGSYLAMCPFRPTLLAVIGRSGNSVSRHGPGVHRSPGIIAGGSIVLWFLSRGWKYWYLRFFLLLA